MTFEAMMKNEEAYNKIQRNAFRENLEQAKLKLALLKENFEYQRAFADFLEWDRKTRGGADGVWPMYIFNGFGLPMLRYLLAGPDWKQIKDLINPKIDTSVCPQRLIDSVLPRLFYDHAVELIELDGQAHTTGEGGCSRRMWTINRDGLKPWERLYKVDLRKKKPQIVKEFEEFLDRAYLVRTENSGWTPDSKRARAEAWDQLEVWKLRKQKNSFQWIASRLHITADLAKKRFYRAYNLTQNKPYDPDLFRRDSRIVKKSSLKVTCTTCPDNPDRGGTCTELCPAALAYVEQDVLKYSAEKLLPCNPRNPSRK